MKTTILLFGICFVLSQICQAQSGGFIINSYNIKTKIVKNIDSVDVNLICRAKAGEDRKNLQFVFSSDAKINSINYQKGNEWIPVSFVLNGRDSLLLVTEGIFSRGNDYSIRFEYKYPVSKLNDTLLMLDRGHRWYPLIMDQIVPFNLTCEIPAGYKALSAGNLVNQSKGEKNIVTWESKVPVFKIPLIIFNPDKFKKCSEKAADFYYYNPDTIKVKEALEKVSSIMKYYDLIYGDYMADRLTLIEVKEFPGVNICSGLLMVGTQSLDAIINGYDDMLILPVAQQWFGAGVYAKYGDKGFPFLSISLPHFVKLIYIRLFQGNETFIKSISESLESYKKIIGTEKDIPLNEITTPITQEKGLLLYAKGPYILSKVEEEMGRMQFESFLKLLYETFKGKILTYNDFEKYLGEADDTSRSLNLFRRLMSGKGL
jgi:hypothetical protein